MRKSTGRVASKMRAPAGTLDHARDADARTARNTAVNCDASSMPDVTRTTAPASLISITGAADAMRQAGADGTTSLTIGTKPTAADPVGAAGSPLHVLTSGATPAEYLLRTHLPASSHLGQTRSRHQRLLDDPCLLPPPTSGGDGRSRQNLRSSKYPSRHH